MRRSKRFLSWLRGPWGPDANAQPDAGPDHCTHVVMLDGTMSSLVPGLETNVGLIFRLLRDVPASARLSLYYEPGIQWRGWGKGHEVMAGVGINRQIRRAYDFLAHRYKPGDSIYLVGYSRGAYAVRALAGMIDRVGLMRADVATPERVDTAYHIYRETPDAPEARRFSATYCHPKVEIEAVGVFDTVRALGNRWPLLWRFAPPVHVFHSNLLGRVVRHGFHALALNETRMAYAPEMWEVEAHRTGDVQQVWFRGTHGDVGGHLGDFGPARLLGNIPLVWMLEQFSRCGLTLPQNWRNRFPQDAGAPSVGMNRGFGKFFLYRRPRRVGVDASEKVHPTAVSALPLGVNIAVLEDSMPVTQATTVTQIDARS